MPMQMTPPIDPGLHHHQLKSVSQSDVELPLLSLPPHDLSSSRAQKMSASCPEQASERIAASNQTYPAAPDPVNAHLFYPPDQAE